MQRLPPQCVPRKQHTGTSLDEYEKNGREDEPTETMLMKKGKRVGSKESRLKNKSGWGVQGGGAAPPPAMRTKKETHRHQSRWILIKIKREKMNPKKRCL